MPNLSTSDGSGWPQVALGAMLWGTDLLLRPTLLHHPGFTPVRVVLYEHAALAALFLPLLIKRRNEWRKASGTQWLSLIFIAWAGSAIATVLLTMAYQLGGSDNGALTATLLQKTQPLFAVLLAGVILRERRRPIFWGLFACALFATYLLSFGLTNPLAALGSPQAASVGCALGAAFLWGSCTVIGRTALDGMRPALVAACRFTLALPLLLVMNAAALLSHSNALAPNFGSGAVLLLLGIVALPDIFGMILYYAGLRSTPASQATLAELAYPVSAMLFSSFFLHQHLALGQWIGIAVLIILLPLIQSTRSVVAPEPSRVPGDLQNSGTHEIPATA